MWNKERKERIEKADKNWSQVKEKGKTGNLYLSARNEREIICAEKFITLS